MGRGTKPLARQQDSDSALVSKSEIKDLFMLMIEAIGLVFRQEQNHGSIDLNYQGIASAHDPGHAHAQALTQDTGQLYSMCAAVYEVPWPLARHIHAAEPGSPLVAGGVAEAAVAAQFLDRHSRIGLLEKTDNLFFGKSVRLHLRPSP